MYESQLSSIQIQANNYFVMQFCRLFNNSIFQIVLVAHFYYIQVVKILESIIFLILFWDFLHLINYIFVCQTEISWVVTTVIPGTIVGSLLASKITDKFGRRATLLYSVCPYIIGTVSIFIAATQIQAYYSR